ncbi:MAG: ATP-dependent RNA helicase HrpA [Planctomycetaceae bacterium]|nr:ATP-dependent RNA helicase HrpA [Planctomycetaceae bacterium]
MDTPDVTNHTAVPTDIPGEVLAHIESAMLRDRPGLGREAVRLRAVKRPGDKEASEGLRLWELFDNSRKLRAARADRRPLAIEYSPDLTISARRDEIAAAIRDNQVVIIAGSTGSGKTTQLPKICLDLGRGDVGHIGITQPRRIAAMSVATRVAKELGSPLGDVVGFQIRFMARTRPTTLVKFMTDGVLLNELRRDRELLAYDTVILDEAHERNLDTDLLLGCIRRILPSRPNFRLIVSSATLDVERFSEYFDGAPVIALEGRTYPVEVRYAPPTDDEDDDPDLDVMILHAVEELVREIPSGDILVFLPGEADIREAADTLARSGPKECLILPLYSRLTPEEQGRVFQTTDRRKIILSTNVAETSLTIPAVRAVIDSGLARMKRVSDKASVERLQIEKISQASAEQRKGRAGRVAPGICVRLYSETDYLKRAAFTDPEIRRASLASVILRLRHLGLGAVEDFPFLDPPQPSRIQEGYRELAELGALDDKRVITASGRRMANLPVEPRFARILLEARRTGALEPALIIVSMLSVQDPRERPTNKKGEAEAAHRRFLHGKSDFLSWLQLWKFYDDALATLPSKSQARKFCRQNFLNYLRMQEWRDIHRQAGDIMTSVADKQEKVNPAALASDKDGGYARLHKALLAGLLGRIGKRSDDGDYQGARGVRFLLWPGSGLVRAAKDRRDASREAGDLPSEIRRKGSLPAWVVTAELAETSRLFGRGVAEIDPLWVEELAGPLAKRSYSEPYYDARSGFVRAREKVEVYGLPVVEGRRVHYGSINPKAAREVFIRQALVEEALTAKLAFYQENVALVRSVADIAHKARQPLMASTEAIYRFYDERIPPDVNNDRALAKFYYEEEKNQPGFLRLTRQYLMDNPPDGITADRFPPTLEAGGRRYPLTYRFHPGHAEDGVTLTVPVADIPNLPAWRLDWLVPGLIGAKVAELLRTLPKGVRRDLTPIPETAAQLVDRLGPPDKRLTDALAEAAFKVVGVRIPDDAWDEKDLPAFLRMNIRAVDRNGVTVGMGRDLDQLAESLKLAARSAFESLDKNLHEKTGLDAWTFGDLPERLEIRSGTGAAAFPALVDEGKTVGIRLFHTRDQADEAMPGGYRRMVYLTLGQSIAKLRKDIRLRFSARAAALSQTLGGGGDVLADEVLASAVDEVFDSAHPARTHRLFLERIAAGKEQLYPVAMELRASVEEAFSQAASIIPGLGRPPTPAHADSYRDVLRQLESLLSPGLLRFVTAEQMRQLPRFVAAAERRLERMNYALGKDKMRLAELYPYRERYETAANSRLTPREARLLIEYRWLLEEWRIGLFAQEAGQKSLGSAKRLDEAWRVFKQANQQ